MMFWKFQANGNDFILQMKSEMEFDVQKMCHRRFGVGADGILLIEVEGDRISYIHLNADGSEADLCVNGIRCVALWYFQHYLKTHVMITIAGTSYDLHYIDDNEVMLNIKLPEVVDEQTYRTGVLHEIVSQFPEVKKTDRNYDRITFMNDNEIFVETFERGVGLTLACGSGMISSYYHCYRAGMVNAHGIVHSEGGLASIRIEDESIQFSSKVYCVFTGICFA